MRREKEGIGRTDFVQDETASAVLRLVTLTGISPFAQVTILDAVRSPW